MHTVTTPWDSSYVRWQNNTRTTLWNNPGGDFQSTPAAQESYARGITDIWLEFNITEAIQEHHQNPETNFGFLLKIQNENEGHNIAFSSSENLHAPIGPKLVLTCDLEDQFPPTVRFNHPQNGDTLSTLFKNDSISAVAFDQDVDTSNGAGIASVIFTLLQTGTVLDSITTSHVPYIWHDFDVTEYPDGEYTLRATALSTPLAGGTTVSEDIQVTIAAIQTGTNKSFSLLGTFFTIMEKSGRQVIYFPSTVPCKGTIYDIYGKIVGNFITSPDNSWYQLPQTLSSNVHIVSVESREGKIVKKVVVVK